MGQGEHVVLSAASQLCEGLIHLTRTREDAVVCIMCEPYMPIYIAYVAAVDVPLTCLWCVAVRGR